jgi:hypothetical protein
MSNHCLGRILTRSLRMFFKLAKWDGPLKTNHRNIKVKLYIAFISFKNSPMPSWWGLPVFNESSYLSLIKTALIFSQVHNDSPVTSPYELHYACGRRVPIVSCKEALWVLLGRQVRCFVQTMCLPE